MKPRFLLWSFLLLLAFGQLFSWKTPRLRQRQAMAASTIMTTNETMRPTTSSDSTSFALLELFTSEGCSSCPPADKLLGEIASEARRSGTRVIPLSFHVDYWNRLGWADPFSDHTFSERQSAYAGALGLESIYTPQLVVNGRREFVGSNGSRAKDEIAQALARQAAVGVKITVAPDAGRTTLQVDYAVTGTDAAPRNAALNLALVERGLATKVPRGENAGRTLHHENVVRVFRSVAADERGTIELPVPSGVDLTNASVVAYVQDRGSMEIAGAAMVDVGK